jgi:hypothetical protein
MSTSELFFAELRKKGLHVATEAVYQRLQEIRVHYSDDAAETALRNLIFDLLKWNLPMLPAPPQNSR